MTTPNLQTKTFIVPANNSVPLDITGRIINNISSTANLFIQIGTGNKSRFNEGDEYTLEDGLKFEQITLINETGSDATVTVAHGTGNVRTSSVTTISGTVTADLTTPATLTSTADDSIAATSTEQVLAINLDRKEALIGNLSSNASNIRVGDSNTGAARGVELAPGQTITLTTTAAIHVYNADAAAQSVSILEVE